MLKHIFENENDYAIFGRGLPVDVTRLDTGSKPTTVYAVALETIYQSIKKSKELAWSIAQF